MAAPFLEQPDAAPNGPKHDYRGHGHGHSRSQHRQAVSARTAQSSIGGSFDTGSQIQFPHNSSGPDRVSQQYDGRRGLHKHTPSLQLNGHFGRIPEDAQTLDVFANSPYIDGNEFQAESAQPRYTELPHSHSHLHDHTYSHSTQRQLPSLNHTHSHSHDHNHNHGAGEDYHHMPAGTMASQDLKHITSDESSALGRAILTLDESLVAVLIPLPFCISAWLEAFGAHPVTKTEQTPGLPLSLLEAILIGAFTLLLVGAYGKFSRAGPRPDRGGDASPGLTLALFAKQAHLERMSGRLLSVVLPFFALARLGTTRVSAFILTAIVTRVLSSGSAGRPVFQNFVPSKLLKGNKFAGSALALQILADVLGVSTNVGVQSLLPGYLALILSLSMFPLPFPTLQREDADSKATRSSKQSPLIVTSADADLTFAAGLVTLLAGTFASYLLQSSSSVSSTSTIGVAVVSVATAVALLLPNPSRLVSRYKVGFAFSLFLVGTSEQLVNSSSMAVKLTQFGLLLLNWGGVFLDSNLHADSKQFHRRRGNSIRPNTSHPLSTGGKSLVWMTRWLIANTVHLPVIHSILSEDDSRPVFYFMLLNLAFMCVQAFYSVVTGSLGLLSDSIHMFFDCFALALGLAAAVMSKWPPSARFPYGLGMLNTLAGFGNGIFLMLISVEIIWEASERVAHGLEMNRLRELFIISVLGMLVNLVGLVAVGHEHHHHGHSHGHSHNHDHSHSHSHSHNYNHIHDHNHDHPHDHDHDHNHSHDHGHSHNHDNVHQHSHDLSRDRENNLHHHHNHSMTASIPSAHMSDVTPLGQLDPNASTLRPNPLHNHTHVHSSSSHDHSHAASHSHHGHSHGHSHSHENENMIGIWLHIMADALGSLAVIVSTILIHYTGYTWWDPVASIIIAVLIFASSVPLVKSCANKLLMTNPETLEFDLKAAVQAVSGLRGVNGVCVPRFWSVELGEGEEKVHGVMHIIVSAREPLEEVRKRAEMELSQRGFQVVVQVERESEGRCWCGGGKLRV